MEPTDRTHEILAQVRSARARDMLLRWLRTESATLIPADWTGEGFTEAQVLGVYLQGYHDHLGGVIMKISEKGNGDKEVRAHKRAYRDAKEFGPEHLAEPVAAILLSPEGSITFQSVAGGGFGEMVEIDKAMPDYLGADRVSRRVITSLLDEWNTESTSVPETMGSVLDRLLDSRHIGKGTIAAWAGRHPGLLTDPRPWLSHGGQPLVNPFALVGRQLPVIVTRGRSHGDLHPGNLLVDRDEGSRSYCLVDLSRYTDSGPLAWDPVYLTLTTVAKFLPTVDYRARDALQLWLLDPRAPFVDSLPLPLRATVTGIHQACDEWARRHSGTAAWNPQRLLCLTAIALILTGRGRLLTPESRAWFFWLAARAATRLVPDAAPPAADWLGLAEPLIAGDVIYLDDRRPPSVADEPPAVGPASEEAESWTGLVAELRVVRFDAADSADLAAQTETLRALLARVRGADDDAGRHLADLAATLDEALRPGAMRAEVRAAGARADVLRAWLLDTLI
jgi:hypothetical protein